MASLVDEYGLGVVAPSFSPIDIASTLDSLDAETIVQMRRAARQAATVLNADVEMGKVVTIYRRLFDDAVVAVQR